MKLAIISDIHGNYEALNTVLEDAQSQDVDKIVCLGDVVGYGPDPNECMRTVQNECDSSVLGNHDAAAIGKLSTAHFNVHARTAIEWTMKALDRHWGAALKKKALKKQVMDYLCVHATPFEPNLWHYITTYQDAQVNFEYFEQQVCFVGHTHIPVIIGEDHGKVYLHQGDSVLLDEHTNRRFIINVGSVGQPRDNDARACYGIIDHEKREFTYRRIPYDIDTYQRKMERAGMPSFLITRVAEGI